MSASVPAPEEGSKPEMVSTTGGAWFMAAQCSEKACSWERKNRRQPPAVQKPAPPRNRPSGTAPGPSPGAKVRELGGAAFPSRFEEWSDRKERRVGTEW